MVTELDVEAMRTGAEVGGMVSGVDERDGKTVDSMSKVAIG